MCNLYLMYYTDAEYGQSFQICSTEARADLKNRIPDDSDTQPEHPPDIIEQSPAGTPNQDSYNNYPVYGDYRGNPFQDYRQRWHDMLYPGDYQSEDIDLNRNGWPDDEELGHEINVKPKTENPGKDEETTPAISSDKGSDDNNEVDTKEDIGTGSEYVFFPLFCLLYG